MGLCQTRRVGSTQMCEGKRYVAHEQMRRVVRAPVSRGSSTHRCEGKRKNAASEQADAIMSEGFDEGVRDEMHGAKRAPVPFAGSVEEQFLQIARECGYRRGRYTGRLRRLYKLAALDACPPNELAKYLIEMSRSAYSDRLRKLFHAVRKTATFDGWDAGDIVQHLTHQDTAGSKCSLHSRDVWDFDYKEAREIALTMQNATLAKVLPKCLVPKTHVSKRMQERGGVWVHAAQLSFCSHERLVGILQMMESKDADCLVNSQTAIRRKPFDEGTDDRSMKRRKLR